MIKLAARADDDDDEDGDVDDNGDDATTKRHVQSFCMQIRAPQADLRERRAAMMHLLAESRSIRL